MKNKDIRWKQRFQNFQRAFLLLKEALEKDISAYNQLENDGIILSKISPKTVVKTAYEAKYLNSAELWLKMIGDRNLMSHTYDFSKFEEIILTIKNQYLLLLNELYSEFLKEIDEE